ncbi:hypothetical protein C2W62_08635 [Candidatus Entotheonella serta]|nr:hypothetical protein C2W62_08635 [Candidatus Entotheonella serta]
MALTPAHALQGIDRLDTTSELTPDTSGDYTIAGRETRFPSDEMFNLRFNTNTGNLRLNGFSISGTPYSRVDNADRVFVRRTGNANSNPLRFRYFAEAVVEGNNIDISPSRPTAIGALVLDNIINRGVLDMFMNVDQGGERANNIERLDMVFSDGIIAPAAANLNRAGFIQMEKSGNNPFQIAVITAVDALGQPAAYGNLILVQPADYVRTNVTTYNT